MDADGQVGQPFLQFQELLQPFFEALEVAGHAADEVVLLAHAVQGEVDDELAVGAAGGNALHFVRNGLEDAVGGDVDDPRPGISIGHLAHFHNARKHKRLATAHRKPVRGAPQRGQHLVPLIQRQLILALHPDVAGQAARIALGRRGKCQVQRQHFGGAKAPVSLEKGDAGQHAKHGVHKQITCGRRPVFCISSCADTTDRV